MSGDDEPFSVLRSGGLHDFKDTGRHARLSKEDAQRIDDAYRLAESRIFCSFCGKKIILKKGIGYCCSICGIDFCEKHRKHKIHFNKQPEQPEVPLSDNEKNSEQSSHTEEENLTAKAIRKAQQKQLSVFDNKENQELSSHTNKENLTAKAIREAEQKQLSVLDKIKNWFENLFRK
ncbi:MAG: hypothetical protein ABIJ74_03900 [archaeon]